MNLNLISSIVGQKWLINPEYAQANLGLVMSILKGDAKFPQEEFKAKYDRLEAHSDNLIGIYQFGGFKSSDIPEGSTAMIPIMGPMMKNSDYCTTGAMELANYVKQADQNPKIKNILFIFDGPGGMVQGTQTLADAVKATEKKTFGYVEDGMACSAHYWVLSCCDEIWSSHATNTIGSIGVYTQMEDWKKYYKKKGLEIHEIYASQSTEKNKDYKDALEGNYDTLRAGHLDPIASRFIDHVKEQRGDKINLEAGDPFKGDAYQSDVALSIGLIDYIGSLEELLSKMEESNSNQFSQSNNNQMSLKKWFASNKAGSDNAEEKVSIDASELNELRTDMEAAQSQLEAAEATNQQLTADLATANSSLETATAKVSVLETENEELTIKVKQYGAQPGATHEGPKKGKENLGEDTVSEQEQFEAYDHNKEAINELKEI